MWKNFPYFLALLLEYRQGVPSLMRSKCGATSALPFHLPSAGRCEEGTQLLPSLRVHVLGRVRAWKTWRTCLPEAGSPRLERGVNVGLPQSCLFTLGILRHAPHYPTLCTQNDDSYFMLFFKPRVIVIKRTAVNSLRHSCLRQAGSPIPLRSISFRMTSTTSCNPLHLPSAGRSLRFPACRRQK
jgi:hypothetical protein